MLILALDTALSGCSAALVRDGEVLAGRRMLMSRGQAEALIPMVAEVMEEADTPFESLDLIAVTVGPGSFTGVRVGLASARALGLAAGVPVHGVTTTEALAAGVTAEERRGRSVLVAVDSRRADLFVQLFDQDLAPLGEAFAVAPEDLAAVVPEGPLVVVGDAAEQALQALAGKDLTHSTAPDIPTMTALAALAEGSKLEARPLYIRPPDAILPKNGGGLRP